MENKNIKLKIFKLAGTLGKKNTPLPPFSPLFYKKKPGIAKEFGGVFFLSPARAQATFPVGADGLPAWVKEVGARQEPKNNRLFLANDYGAVGNGVKNSTKAIQKAIDACAKAGGGIVSFKAGGYVTGAIFLKSNVNLRLDKAVTLLGSQEDADYPSIWTRVAGIEMNWPAALINVNDQKNVKISGGGTIDGRGQKWWARYWKLRLG